MLFGKVLLKFCLALGLTLQCRDVLIASTAAAPPGVRTPVDAQTTADEDLYLCYLLPVLYQQTLGADGKMVNAEAKAAATNALVLARTVREHAKDGKVDPRVEKMYSDLLAVAELREKSLLAAERAGNAVRRQKRADSLQAAPETIGKAAGTGSAGTLLTKSLQDAFRNPNQKETPKEAAIQIGVGVTIALGSFVLDLFNEWSATRDQEAAARQGELAELKRFIEEVDARQRNTLFDLIKERGWKDVEPPGEAQTRRIAAFQKAEATQNPDDQLRVLREALAANPRNFFLHLAVEEALSAKTNRSSAELMESSKRLIQASRLVPEAAIYDEHRLAALQSSAFLCVEALAQESTAAGERWEPNATSKYAVTTLEDVCRRVPQDVLPFWNLLRACAYLANRQLPLAEALVAGLRENESKLATLVPELAGTVDCLQAGIQSVKGDAESGLKFLSKAVAAGAPVTKDWWTDADYRGIRTAHPKEFAELLAVKAAWTIEFGVFNDDVVLQNNSGFELSGVQVRLKGRSGKREFDINLTAERIPRGELVRWRNALSIPKDPGITAALVLDCDQARTITPAEFVR
jgi:hypothetical protein